MTKIGGQAGSNKSVLAGIEADNSVKDEGLLLGGRTTFITLVRGNRRSLRKNLEGRRRMGWVWITEVVVTEKSK